MPDPDLEMGGGGGHTDPQKRGGGLQKNSFSAPRASVWSKTKGGEEAGASGPSLGSATGGDFKGGPEVTRFQVVSFAISANFGFNLSVKVHSKMTSFWLVFSGKTPVKSEKLALMEGRS